MTILPRHIVDRLKAAGDAANRIRMGEAEGEHSRSYKACIDEIDAATDEAKRQFPELFQRTA